VFTPPPDFAGSYETIRAHSATSWFFFPRLRAAGAGQRTSCVTSAEAICRVCVPRPGAKARTFAGGLPCPLTTRPCLPVHEIMLPLPLPHVPPLGHEWLVDERVPGEPRSRTTTCPASTPSRGGKGDCRRHASHSRQCRHHRGQGASCRMVSAGSSRIPLPAPQSEAPANPTPSVNPLHGPGESWAVENREDSFAAMSRLAPSRYCLRFKLSLRNEFPGWRPRSPAVVSYAVASARDGKSPIGFPLTARRNPPVFFSY